jgi:hypothetical protein
MLNRIDELIKHTHELKEDGYGDLNEMNQIIESLRNLKSLLTVEEE